MEGAERQDGNMPASPSSSQPLPSFETLLHAARTGTGPLPRLTLNACRLFLTLQGPMNVSVFVLDADRNPDATREPYFQRVDPDETIWHPISREPLTQPKVSSILVSVDDLEDFPSVWLDGHEPHAEPDSDDCVFGRLGAEGAGDAEDGDGEVELLRCCGTDLPREIPPLLVEAAEGPYVTVHDYVAAVHPWLLGLRGNILWALNDITEGKPLPAETDLAVGMYGPDSLNIMTEDEWFSDARSAYKTRGLFGRG
ncbi:hypothetical protein LA080_003540 [Diaporthe eres]|uniref:Uncharacterized protein n=1 Tax=Diaporthe vaccinii TaxID=105482 RepID=A0ABR4FE71_9PEZI|nr:hypothetical protein LA080_003540 [Diaporthe eres]